ncbi:hypothetical protein B0T11DRAFT_101156 [Plectosphaerella cucumerina]|uniref:Uncharacterized protein n=1 Tax=Plectosphaerella cucumerina TaxID=40658 RepID=A0A8K0TER7_9PEZI|nr:hypothetical protein B0T11DRAFT_101156 [Plectosphaerella cucumerina]
MESMVLRMPSSWWAMSCGGFGLLTRTLGKCTERCSVAPTVIASVTFTGTQTMPPQNLLGGVLYACRQTLWVRASGASRRRGAQTRLLLFPPPNLLHLSPPTTTLFDLRNKYQRSHANHNLPSPPVFRPAPLSSSGSVAPVTVPGLGRPQRHTARSGQA